MDKLFIIANWKSNKNEQQALEWFDGIGGVEWQTIKKEVIICPPFPLLKLVSETIEEKSIPMATGAQDISKFDGGPYTGEVSGQLLKDFAAYCIIGHSERRKNFSETDEDIAKKISLAKKYNITPILCVQNDQTPVPGGVEIVAYEPVFAIGSGNPDTPENADLVAEKIKQKTNIPFVLYGGSITPENVHAFTAKSNISGVLVGTKSLDPFEFTKIIINA
jgi:triosephosphate isomerase (TIM)